jgi:hypothetical protein
LCRGIFVCHRRLHCCRRLPGVLADLTSAAALLKFWSGQGPCARLAQARACAAPIRITRHAVFRTKTLC